MMLKDDLTVDNNDNICIIILQKGVKIQYSKLNISF